MQSLSMALRICKDTHKIFAARPSEQLIPKPARAVLADGLLHVGAPGVGRLTCQNVSSADAVEILVTGENGAGAVYSKVLAASGGTAGLGSEMDLTPYSAYDVYVRALSGTPNILVTEHTWKYHETSR